MVHQAISQRIIEQRDELAQAIVTRQYEQQPQLTGHYDKQQRDKSLRDTQYHLSYLAEAIDSTCPDLFTDYAGWVGTVLEKRHIPIEIVTGSFQALQEILLLELPEEMHEPVIRYIQAGVERLAPHTWTSSIPSFIDPDTPYGSLAAQYLDLLLTSARQEASQLITGQVTNGTQVKDIYLHVFQPVQHEIGRLWQVNEISVAQEHYATAVTQLIMSQLYPHIFSTARNGHTIVAACVGGELHELGVRMIADFFEMEGWDTFYLGANTPTPSIVQTILERQADLLAVSATMTMHVGAVRELIAAIRASRASTAKIMVGGYPFNVAPDLWQKVGADHYAPNADSALATAKEIVNGSW